MAKHIWSVFCRQAMVDPITNNVSLLNSIEEIKVISARKVEPNEVVAVPVQEGSVVIFLCRDEKEKSEDETTIKFQVISPENKEFPDPISVKIDSLKENKRVRYILQVSALPYTTDGTYWIAISINSKEVAKLPFDMKLSLLQFEETAKEKGA